MSFGLGRGRPLDDAPGAVGVGREELPPLPDDLLGNPRGGWIDPRAWFADPILPLEIEIGSGKGTFLVQQGEAQPGTNFLGIEWAREFYLYAADRVRRRGLPNVRVLNTDASEFLRWRLPDGIVRVIHLYFPDPWPKARHHKNRIVQYRFLSECWRVLEDAGEVRIVTDHEGYWAWIEEHAARCCGEADSARAPGPRFERLEFSPPDSADEGELVGSNFERKYRREGRPFHALILRKVSPAA
jgi:tRNA (guanine-N7-)-methyltransferase